MRKEMVIPVLLAIIGLVFLAGGASAHMAKQATKVACEACAMEIRKEDPSTFSIVTADDVTRYGCCPMCALMVAIYYEDATVSAECFACGRDITIVVEDENLSSWTPYGEKFNVSIIFGGACMKNKIVCSQDCAATVKNTYAWAADLPVKTLIQTFSMSKMMLPQKTIGPRQMKITEMTYYLMAIGIGLLALAPISWRIMKRKLQ